MENASIDLLNVFCRNCGEYRYECVECGVTYCIFCEQEVCCGIFLTIPATFG
jgi:hypothetical protein